jgi:hypothetical protein
MRATILNCTLKPSPAESNTEALARVVVDALEREDVATEVVRVVDFDAKPGVTGNEDGAHHVIAELAQGMIDIGYTVPGQAWTYWNMGPGPGPSYLESDHNKDWSKTTGDTAAQNLVAVARALAGKPVPAPPSG